MMLWKCCTQYASKFGKLSSHHRTGKDQFSFQSQKQCQRMFKLLHNLTHLTCSNFSKLGFNSMWTSFKLVLEKAKETEIKLPTSVGSSKKQESPRKTSISALLTIPKVFDCVDDNKLLKILKEMGIPDHLTCLLRNLYTGQEATELDMEQQTGSK